MKSGKDSISSSAIAVYIQPPSQYIFNRHRSIYSSAIAVYIPKPGQRAAGRKCHSQSETRIKTSVFYLQPVLSVQPVPVSVSAPVILSVLKGRNQDDRHRQPVGFMPHDSNSIPYVNSIRTRAEPFFLISVLHLSSIFPPVFIG